MTFLVPLMLFGWVPFTVLLFCRLKPHRAVLVSVIGGILFLPQVGYDFRGMPAYTKSIAIALGIVFGGRLSGKRGGFVFTITKLDYPMLIWCLCPIFSSLSNDLGWYDGVSSSFEQAMLWGVPYFAGRVYFRDMESVGDLCIGIVVGGLLYMPLCLYEVRMSPQLSKQLYGFFPHSWGQHFRQEGFRPIVFMQHGLMVSLWMSTSSVVAFWMWKSKQLVHIKGVSASIVFVSLVVACVLCKSVNGLFAVSIGCLFYYSGGQFYNRKSRAVTLLLLTIPLYFVLRTNGIVTVDDMAAFAARFTSDERIQSLTYRLNQEGAFFQRALERPLFGWGGYGRGKPIDPVTGVEMAMVIDSLWLIAIRSRGFVGLVGLYTGMLLGPWLVLRRIRRTVTANETDLYLIMLSLIVVLFMIDCLLNGMINPVYILISGALLSNYINSSENEGAK